jgi:hypothetical protein
MTDCLTKSNNYLQICRSVATPFRKARQLKRLRRSLCHGLVSVMAASKAFECRVADGETEGYLNTRRMGRNVGLRDLARHRSFASGGKVVMQRPAKPSMLTGSLNCERRLSNPTPEARRATLPSWKLSSVHAPQNEKADPRELTP